MAKFGEKVSVVLAKRAFIKSLVYDASGTMFTITAKRKKAKLCPDTGQMLEYMTLNCRTGVKKHLAGGDSTISQKDDLISVYVVNGAASGYRCFSADLVTEIKIKGQRYTFTI